MTAGGSVIINKFKHLILNRVYEIFSDCYLKIEEFNEHINHLKLK